MRKANLDARARLERALEKELKEEGADNNKKKEKEMSPLERAKYVEKKQRRELKKRSKKVVLR